MISPRAAQRPFVSRLWQRYEKYAGSLLGPLQENFQFEVPDGYAVLIGANNSGKSGVLQLSFRVPRGCGDVAQRLLTAGLSSASQNPP